MKFQQVLRITAIAFLLLFTIHDLRFTAPAQQRDYFTEAEIELIRDAQQIDQRIAVLTHAIDRRFTVLKIDVGTPAKKPSGDWGELPSGPRLQTLNDIKYILRKAIEDIDNLADRPDSMVVDPNDKKPKGYSDLFPKAVRLLAAAAARYQPALQNELDKTTIDAEKGSILASLEMCAEITAAVAKLPAPAKKAN